MATLWIDITELFGHFRAVGYATGVSRVVVNLAEELRREPGAGFAEAAPFFFDPARRVPIRLDDASEPLPALFAGYRDRLVSEGRDPARRPRALKRLAGTLPRPLRYRAIPSEHGVSEFLANGRRRGRRPRRATFGPGDLVFLPGSFWLDRYARRVAGEARRTGAGVAAMVHDVIPLSHPGWWRPSDVVQFRTGMEAVLPGCTAIVTISAHTAGEIRRLVGLPDGLRVVPCRLADIDRPPVEPRVTPRIAPLMRERYVLNVASANVRKNHGFLIEAWSRLADSSSAETPRLVFAGGGTAAIAAAAGGHAIGLEDVSDDEREALVGNAWMTAYPSLAEGYGLPVAEALARGRVTMASLSGGLAEVAPGLVDPIDPGDPGTAADVVTRYLRDPATHAARASEITTRYRPTTWAETAAAVRAVLETVSRG